MTAFIVMICGMFRKITVTINSWIYKIVNKEEEMFKVLKNLKASWISVIIIVLFLGLQAMADLALPDYTSKIVNIRYPTRWN